MRLRFFRIPTLGSDAAAQELNDFLANHLILDVEKHFAPEGNYWSVCVTYLESTSKAPAKSRIDYKETLDPATFVIFSRLREIRKALAEQDGIPVYTVFTNDQLAEMAKQRLNSLDELRALPGVGEIG